MADKREQERADLAAARLDAAEHVESEEEVNDRIKVGYGAKSGRVILTIDGCRHTLGRRGEALALATST